MKFRQAIKMAIFSVRSNKMRSILTMLGIVIGVMAVTLLISLVQGYTQSILGELEGFSGNNLTCSVFPTSPKLTPAELKNIQETGGVGKIAAQGQFSGSAVANGNDVDMAVYTVSSNYYQLEGIELSDGRYLTFMDDDYRLQNCLMGQAIAKELFGDTSGVCGKTVRINGKDFNIVGLLHEDGANSLNGNDNKVFIPFSVGQQMIGTMGVTTFIAAAQSSDTVPQAIETLESFLQDKFGKDQYTVFNMQEVIELMESIYNTMSYLLGGIAGISLFVGGVGIMNMMLTTVTERTKEIGIRKAIGAQRSDIIVQFLLEAIMLCLSGGIAGVLLSAGVLSLFGAAFPDISFALKWQVVTFALAFTFIIGVLFGWYPANKAAKLKPIEALRFE